MRSRGDRFGPPGRVRVGPTISRVGTRVPVPRQGPERDLTLEGRPDRDSRPASAPGTHRVGQNMRPAGHLRLILGAVVIVWILAVGLGFSVIETHRAPPGG